MSIQFGRWNSDEKPVEPNYLEKVNTVLAPYGPDGANSYVKENISIVYHAFHTTRESRRESQPHVTASGAVITWDGRLDNRGELIRESNEVLTATSTDVAVVEAAYERWGTQCFARLIGDWALSIWDPHTRSLILAKDPIGTRHLYYSIGKDQVTWSTIMDPLVLFTGETRALCEEYIAGWFSLFPAAHLTPYIGIDSVPPSSFVLIHLRRRTISKYWSFDPGKRIRYRSDAEYEEHFRAVFREAVRRRLRSETPVLAELSGGMDSSSVLCMADTIIAEGSSETPRVDTISYYDDSEPNWNERPYFTKVEEKRGRTGCHIDVGNHEFFNFKNGHFAATPGSGGRPDEVTRQFAAWMTSQGNRVVLSGVGGDEVTGGVPTPTPELADLLASGQFRKLAHQLKVWALNKRKPWFHLFFEAARRFFPPALVGVPKNRCPAPWLNPAFVRRNRMALRGYDSRLKLFGPLPTFQENVSTLAALQRQMGCESLSFNPPCEKRYPYLDRTFLEFLYAIPREQLVRPGQRRSLLRRALTGIVPEEILQRRRKAFAARKPALALQLPYLRLCAPGEALLLADILRIVDRQKFLQVLRDASQGLEVRLVKSMRTLVLEYWLCNLREQGCLGETH